VSIKMQATGPMGPVFCFLALSSTLLVTLGLVPGIHAFAERAKDRGWPGQTRP
jgi:hypothetical protein